MTRPDIYAGRPLDGGEECARNAAPHPEIHTNSAEEPFFYYNKIIKTNFTLMRSKILITFIIPFIGKNQSKNWDLACKCLNQTLNSLCNTPSSRFRIVVCAEDDLPFVSDKRIHLIQTSKQSIPDVYDCFIRDKMRKINTGWEFAREHFETDYIMKMDADDFISNKLIDWLEFNKGCSAYRIGIGWLWRQGSRRFIEKTSKFDLICGSSVIIKSPLADRKGPFLTSADGFELDEESKKLETTDRRILLPGAGTGTLLLNDSHGRAEAMLQYLGEEMKKIEFPAAVYRVSNANSLTGNHIRKYSARMIAGRIKNTRPITRKIRDEFKIP